MNPVYTVDGDVFDSLAEAIEYANHVYIKTGIIVGIEEVR